MDQEITGRYLIKNPFKPPKTPHICLMPDDVMEGDLWLCDCGQYHLGVSRGGFGYDIYFTRITFRQAKKLLKKRGKLDK